MPEERKIAQAMAEEKENRLKDFMTFMEEEVPLPSGGATYSSGASFVTIRPMRGIEEDILTNQRLVRNGKAFDMILSNCVTNWNGINQDELLFGDMNALFIAIRSISYGSDYNIEITCPECSHKDNIELSLTDFSNKMLGENPITVGQNLFLWTSRDGFKITFKLMTSKDSKNIQEIERKRKADKFDNPEATVTDILTQVIVSIQSPKGTIVKDKLEIQQIIKKYLPVTVIQEFTNYMNKIRPDFDMSYNHECSGCGNVLPIQIPITAEFFWPAGRQTNEGRIA
jgi:hypothetical protein